MKKVTEGKMLSTADPKDYPAISAALVGQQIAAVAVVDGFLGLRLTLATGVEIELVVLGKYEPEALGVAVTRGSDMKYDEDR